MPCCGCAQTARHLPLATRWLSTADRPSNHAVTLGDPRPRGALRVSSPPTTTDRIGPIKDLPVTELADLRPARLPTSSPSGQSGDDGLLHRLRAGPFAGQLLTQLVLMPSLVEHQGMKEGT